MSAEAEAHGIDLASPDEGPPLINDVGILGALAAWRVTQGIYRFDPDVYDAVIKTPVTGDLPHDILFNMPEWCVYIETPGMTFLGLPLVGFFSHLEYDAGDGRKELRLVLDHSVPEHDRPRLMSQVIHLGPWSLQESVERAMREAERVSGGLLGSDMSFPSGTAEILQIDYAPLVSLVLYICSVNGEIGDGARPVRPKPTKTKKGQRMFPAPKVTAWDVGVRMGAALRKDKAQARESISRDGEKQRSSPRPHIRRAHWHGYWSGPKDGERKFALQWMPPILVRGDAGSELPVTIKPVK
ncbi:MAG: hypothetical protein AB1796_04675 [Bacillota bacterium]